MSRPSFTRFSVFFPMWNEEEYLQRALNAAIELGDELIANGTVQDYEMVIVNDASTDAT
ncbi:MAG: glycosyltransferase, partial [Ilumatobacteraceae bacterium]